MIIAMMMMMTKDQGSIVDSLTKLYATNVYLLVDGLSDTRPPLLWD